jgi:endosialidase-like protein
VNGGARFTPGGSGGVINLGTPNAETGMTIVGTGITHSNRADLRFDGASLKLVAGVGTGPPLSTNGLVITLTGDVGIGDSLPSAKLQVFRSAGESIVPAIRGDYGDPCNSLLSGGGPGEGTGVWGCSSATNGVGVNGRGLNGSLAGSFIGNVDVDGHLTVNSCTGCTIASDQNLKANFTSIDPRSMLKRLATLPIRAWNYKGDEESIRHIGPMAQDFRAAFQLGKDDKHIDMIDANGVTMAAIQGLYQLMQEKDRQIERLQTRLRQVERRVRRRRQ